MFVDVKGQQGANKILRKGSSAASSERSKAVLPKTGYDSGE